MLHENRRQGSLPVSLEGHQLPPVRSGHLPVPAHCPTRQCSCPWCARGSRVHIPSLWRWAEDSASHAVSAPNLTHGGRMLTHPLKHPAPPAKAASACLLCTEVNIFLPGDAFSAVDFQTQAHSRSYDEGQLVPWSSCGTETQHEVQRKPGMEKPWIILDRINAEIKKAVIICRFLMNASIWIT